jgi:hypothetical protein
MKCFIKTSILFTILCFFSIRLSAQSEKVEFNAKWKQNVERAVIVITITNGEAPFTFFVYDGSPFKGGKLISKTENVITKTFEVEIDKKMKVYVCLFKDEKNINCKWLDISE